MSSLVPNSPIVAGHTVNTGKRQTNHDYQRFRQNLKRALGQASDSGRHGLRKVADKLVEAALAGESWAILAIRDTLDGKPAQTVQLSSGQQSYVIMIPVQQDSAADWEQQVAQSNRPVIDVVPRETVVNDSDTVSTSSPATVSAQAPAGVKPDPAGG